MPVSTIRGDGLDELRTALVALRDRVAAGDRQIGPLPGRGWRSTASFAVKGRGVGGHRLAARRPARPRRDAPPRARRRARPGPRAPGPRRAGRGGRDRGGGSRSTWPASSSPGSSAVTSSRTTPPSAGPTGCWPSCARRPGSTSAAPSRPGHPRPARSCDSTSGPRRSTPRPGGAGPTPPTCPTAGVSPTLRLARPIGDRGGRPVRPARPVAGRDGRRRASSSTWRRRSAPRAAAPPRRRSSPSRRPGWTETRPPFSPPGWRSTASWLPTGRPSPRPGAGSRGTWLIADEMVTALEAEAIALVDARHEREPLAPGVPRAELRRTLARSLRRRVSADERGAGEIVDALVEALVDAGRLGRTGDALRNPARSTGTLPAAVHAAMDRLEAALSVVAPPALGAAARDARCPAEGIRALEAAGRIVRVEPDLAWSRSSYCGTRGPCARPRGPGAGHAGRPARRERHEPQVRHGPARGPRSSGRPPAHGRGARARPASPAGRDA